MKSPSPPLLVFDRRELRNEGFECDWLCWRGYAVQLKSQRICLVRLGWWGVEDSCRVVIDFRVNNVFTIYSALSCNVEKALISLMHSGERIAISLRVS